jgi:hypothetical protein
MPLVIRSMSYGKYSEYEIAPPTAVPLVRYRESSNGASIEIQGLPGRGDLYVGPLPHGTRCLGGRRPSDLHFVREMTGDPDQLILNVHHLRLGDSTRELVFCLLEPLTTQTSFVDRRIEVHNYALSSRPPGEQSLAWSLDLSDLPDARFQRFVGGIRGARPETERVLDASHPQVEVYWESNRRASQRNIILVVIGALIALGAATLLEAVRPYVHIIASKVRRKAQMGP